MRSFFKYVLATITGIGIVVVLLIIGLIAIITSTVSQMSSGKQTPVLANSVLYISLDHDITERIVTASVQHGWRLREISLEKNSLEEIFKQLSQPSAQ